MKKKILTKKKYLSKKLFSKKINDRSDFKMRAENTGGGGEGGSQLSQVIEGRAEWSGPR